MNKIEQFISRHLLNRISKREDLHKVVHNSAWVIGDKLFRLGAGFIINVQITNYLGAESFGLLNAAIAFAALFVPFTNLGLDNILLRELVKHPRLRNVLLGSVVKLKSMGSAFALLLVGALSYFWFEGDWTSVTIALIQLCVLFVTAMDVMEIHYQSVIKNKYTVYSKNAAFFVFAVIKITLLVQQASLIAFALAILGEYALGWAFQMGWFVKNGGTPMQWQARPKVMKSLLKDSWMQALSVFVIMIYMRTDQLMLAKMIDNTATGVYSAAVRISEVWYFIPSTIVGSVSPALVSSFQLKDKALFYSKLQRLFNILVWMSILVAAAMQFIAHPFIDFVYKPEFARSAQVLIIHVWAGMFVAFGQACSYYYVVKNKLKLNFYRTTAGAIANVLLNLWLIPIYGVVGAAIGTLISQAISTVFATWFFKDARELFFMFFKALNPLQVIADLKRK